MVNFKEILQTEIQIRRVNKYWPQEISVWILTHPENYTLDMERIFFESKSSGKVYRMVLLEEVEDMPEVQSIPEEGKTSPEPNTPERNKLLQTLHKYMLIYARQFKTTIDALKWEIYKTYWVQSRSELSDDDINILLKKYKPLPDNYLAE